MKTIPTTGKKIPQPKLTPQMEDRLILATRALQQNARSIAERFSEKDLENINNRLDEMRDLERQLEGLRSDLAVAMIQMMTRI